MTDLKLSPATSPYLNRPRRELGEVMPARPLSEKRKADRAQMITGVDALAKRYGLTTEIIMEGSPDAFLGPRASMIYIRGPHGLTATVDFDGDTRQTDVHVVPWHSVKDPARLSRSFAECSVNSFHFHKATTIAHGYLALVAKLAVCFEQIKSGEAFQ